MQLLSRCQAVVGQSFSCQSGKSCWVVIRQLSGDPFCQAGKSCRVVIRLLSGSPFCLAGKSCRVVIR